VRAFFLALAALAMPLAGADSLVNQAYDHFYNLEFDEAIALFQRDLALHPDSAELHNHLAQSIVFREMYRDGALESELVSGNNSFLRRPRLNPTPETEKWFLDEIATAVRLSQARLAANPKDAAALYAEGIAYGLRSDYYWVVKKAWRDSLKDATAARRLHNRVSELQPGNVDARLVQGLHDYIVGSLPLTFRMLGFLVGIRGDKEKGLRTVEDVMLHGTDNRIDSQVMLCALYRRENQPRKAIPLVQDLVQKFPRNYLLRLELAEMYSMAGDGAAGLDAMREVAALKGRNAPGYDRLSWERIYYQEGTIQFWYRDLGAALENLKKAAAAPERLDLNTGALVWLRMGQIYDLTNRRAQALDAYKRSIAFAPDAEAAQESRKYLGAPYHRT
jgi:tetratricopeptide (TPR) repeat protein